MSDQPAFMPGQLVHAVSRSADKLDIYATSSTGEIFTAAWQPDLPGDAGMPAGWRGWWPLSGGRSVAGAAITSTSRSADKLDVFMVGADSVVHTAAWEPAEPKWSAWRPIPGISAPAGSRVECISRSADKLDIFVTDTDGRIQTSAWEPSFGSSWSAWRQVAGGVVSPGAAITAVCRSADCLDIFVADPAGAVQTSAWEPSFGAEWSAWRQIAGGEAPSGAPIAAVSRSADRLDVFVTDPSGRVITSAWEAPFGAAWSAWRQIAGGVVSPGAAIAAVSRNTDFIDVFVVDPGSAVQTSAWEPSFGADWSPWHQVASGEATPGASIEVVSRAVDHLDIFLIGNDGRVTTAAWDPTAGANWRGWWPIG